MLELQHIKKYYKMGDNVVKALDDVSLTISDGEFVTIIGPSGSGKSTMMNILGCLDVATEGNYFVDGTEISKFSENQLAFLRNKKMGFIFQGFNLLSNLSALENVELPLIYQGVGMSERRKRAEEALEMVGMKERMKHKPTELSGGQQQRVAIARALATKPTCILADEPTGNLDSKTGDEIMKILHELNKQGTTIVIITHNDEIASKSTRVVRIHDGKIFSDVRQNVAEETESEKRADAEISAKSTKARREITTAKSEVKANGETSKVSSNETGTEDHAPNNLATKTRRKPAKKSEKEGK